MSFLYVLEQWRHPILDVLFSFLTVFGEESLFLLLALWMFWCCDKKNAYYFMIVSFIGLSANQFLKLLCRIPRPWVLDPNFTIVERARAAATGYSFPSGHTQTATGAYGCVARVSSRKSVKIVSAILIGLVAFSRMYLGVHTPKDVLVSLLIGGVLVFALYPWICRAMTSPPRMIATISSLIVMAIALVVYVECFPFPADVDPSNLAEGRKNAWTVLSCAVSLLVVYAADHHRLHFETAAPPAAQGCKLGIGMILLLALKVGLKAPLLSLFHGHPIAHACRYFIVIVFAGVLWPMTFPFWTRCWTKNTKEKRHQI